MHTCRHKAGVTRTEHGNRGGPRRRLRGRSAQGGTKKTHYLRRSYADPTQLWELKRRTEIKAFYWPVGGLWHIQNHVEGGQSRARGLLLVEPELELEVARQPFSVAVGYDARLGFNNDASGGSSERGDIAVAHDVAAGDGAATRAQYRLRWTASTTAAQSVQSLAPPALAPPVRKASR